MSSGAVEVLTYEEVAAYQAEQGVATYVNNSGTVTGGYWVTWSETGGYQGNQGWDMGPTAGWSAEQVSQAIADGGGTLNTVFANWGADLGTKLKWVINMYNAGCAYEVS